MTDNSEGVFGDRFVQEINVTAGQIYYLLIDNFTSNTTPFILDWTFTNGASLNCTPLPIELFSFTGTIKNNSNYIEWVTASEHNNDYFTLERSTDGEYWENIYQVKGAGNSSTNTYYNYYDNNRTPSVNYYKLTQYDFNGTGKESFIISVNNKDNRNLIKTTIYDLMGRVYEDTTSPGVYIIHKEYDYGNPEIIKLYVGN